MDHPIRYCPDDGIRETPTHGHDPGSGGPEHDFATPNTSFMAWKLMRLVRTLKDADGVPA
jgi:hypothetical protein